MTRFYESTRLSTPPNPLLSLKLLDVNLVEVIVTEMWWHANVWRSKIWRLSLFHYPASPEFQRTPPPNKFTQSPMGMAMDIIWSLTWSLIHTIKIHVHRFDAKIIFVSAYCPWNPITNKKNQIWRGKWAKSQTKAQKSAKDDFIREIW